MDSLRKKPKPQNYAYKSSDFFDYEPLLVPQRKDRPIRQKNKFDESLFAPKIKKQKKNGFLKKIFFSFLTFIFISAAMIGSYFFWKIDNISSKINIDSSTNTVCCLELFLLFYQTFSHYILHKLFVKLLIW